MRLVTSRTGREIVASRTEIVQVEMASAIYKTAVFLVIFFIICQVHIFVASSPTGKSLAMRRERRNLLNRYMIKDFDFGKRPFWKERVLHKKSLGKLNKWGQRGGKDSVRFWRWVRKSDFLGWCEKINETCHVWFGYRPGIYLQIQICIVIL